jgi:predicted lipoprotein with Yx(FWY)xxD motif
MRTRVLMAVVAAGAIGLAACGGDNSSTSSTAAPAAASATTAAASSATTAAPATTAAGTSATTAPSSAGGDYGGGGYAVPATTAAPAAASSAATSVTLSDTKLGKVLADAKGHTLYVFTKDSNGTSACSGGCAAAWPPVMASGTPTAAAGITATAWSTITRADGSTQLAVNGQPLYTYAEDAAAGDVSGQGSGQLWWVVGPDGTAIKS